MSRTLYNLLAFGAVGLVFHDSRGFGQQSPGALSSRLQHAPVLRDGEHDFDFEIGTWKTHLSRLSQPLTGSKEWVDYVVGTTTVRKVWNGRATLVELEVNGPTGHISGASISPAAAVAR